MNATRKQADLGFEAVAGLVLAAGKGTRMRSKLPKVLHRAAGKTLLDWGLTALQEAGVAATCVVLSEDHSDFAEFLKAHAGLRVAVQRNRQGTGDAVAAAAWSFAGVTPAPYAAGYALQGTPLACEYVLIMAGDVPGIQAASLSAFMAAVRSHRAPFGVLGMELAQPTGYGRLVLDGSDLLAIVEEKDADAATRRLTACNTGIMMVQTSLLFSLLHELSPQNAQREYYLTDCVQLARARGQRVVAHLAPDATEFAGVNDRAQLAAAEERLVARKRQALLAAGVSLQLPATIYIEDSVEVGADTSIGSGCHLAGSTRIGAGCLIGPGAVLIDTEIPPGERVPPLTVRLAGEA